MSSAALNREVTDAAVRLAEALASPADSRILAPQIVREIVYRVLASEEGKVLRLLTSQPNRHGQIARVLRRIHAEYAGDLDVASLAREANMGLSSFHHAFKEATATSPLQYLKSVRLHRARALLVLDGANAQDAARLVGYASASQFSREYRRMFGVTPASDRRRLGLIPGSSAGSRYAEPGNESHERSESLVPVARRGHTTPSSGRRDRRIHRVAVAAPSSPYGARSVTSSRTTHLTFL